MVKHLNFSQKMFLLKHVLVSNCQCYHFILVASIVNCYLKNMLVELCASNYATSNGLVNGVDVTFQDYIENNPKPFIWIDLYNSQIGINAHIKNSHIDEQFPPIDKKWTKLQIGSNPSHIITRIQFPIQLVTTRTIHQTQGLTFDRLAFDPSGVTKHGLTYTAIFQNPF